MAAAMVACRACITAGWFSTSWRTICRKVSAGQPRPRELLLCLAALELRVPLGFFLPPRLIIGLRGDGPACKGIYLSIKDVRIDLVPLRLHGRPAVLLFPLPAQLRLAMPLPGGVLGALFLSGSLFARSLSGRGGDLLRLSACFGGGAGVLPHLFAFRGGQRLLRRPEYLLILVHMVSFRFLLAALGAAPQVGAGDADIALPGRSCRPPGARTSWVPPLVMLPM